jgi:hypothetical protein
MERRDFIKIIAAGSLTLLGKGFIGVRSGFPYQAALSVSTEELVGKEPPPLSGDSAHLKLRKLAFEAFSEMRKEARRDQIEIDAISSYRDFAHQRRIWNRKFAAHIAEGLSSEEAIARIVKYSAIPGTSRHHWGTEVDVIDAAARPQPKDDPLQRKYYEKGGPFEGLARWLRENASRYGFFQVYTDDPGRNGFAYEPWHISFAELSIPLLKQFLEASIERYVVDGTVKGSRSFSREFLLRYNKHYGLGINRCLIPPEARPSCPKPHPDHEPSG